MSIASGWALASRALITAKKGKKGKEKKPSTHTHTHTLRLSHGWVVVGAEWGVLQHRNQGGPSGKQKAKEKASGESRYDLIKR